MKITTCLLLTFLLAGGLFAQQPLTERRFGEILVQLQPGSSLQTVLSTLNRNTNNAFSLKKNVAKSWGIYLLQFNENQENGEQLLAMVRRMPSVQAAQWNHKVEERSLEPNDTEWWRQGDMSLINAPDVWETSTGGLTLNGDTIVAAVLEKGALFTHPDLAPNRWWNWYEIPNNGIDDDNNGFIDDFGGWNPQTQADDLGTKAYHGTAVNGIIGAKGNNSLGVTGVNWNVKLMNIAGIDYESNIIEGYEYVANTRRLYNQTNGAKGAFVVVTNASFGFDDWKETDHPMWCSVYDSLGRLGVLSVAATTNRNVDVDVVGDMPTTCTSEYLITVTNIKKTGAKETNAGYGSVSIDLGAPGTDSYSTYNSGGINNDVPSYGALGGTSAATPHVTGGIALLYSLGCESFTADALTDPISCARRVRDAILENTEPNATLAGITTTGGHLDLSLALSAIRKLCQGAPVGPLDIIQVRTLQGGDRLRIFYQTPNFQPYNFRVFNILGQQLFESKLTPLQFSENYVDFDMTFLPSGVYVMSIGRGDVATSRKFIKI
jgi:serine protease